MIIWDPCSKTCGGSGVQKCMRVCVGQLSMNSVTCDSVCPGSKFVKRACIIHDCSDLLIEDLSVGSQKWITYQQFFQFGTIFFSVEYNSLGCFKDSTPRALPLLLKSFRGSIDWTDMTKIVRACADLAKECGLPVFGIQYSVENVGVDRTPKTRTISTDLPEAVRMEWERMEPIMYTKYE